MSTRVGGPPAPSSPRLLAIAVLVCLVGALLTTAPAAASQPSAEASVDIDLEGMWRFATGDDDAWSDPDFDDSAWEEVEVPADGGQEVFADYDGFAWFRLDFELPEGIDGVNLVASMGFIDDADEVFLNGQRIGATGSFPPDGDSQWFERRLYPVPADAPVLGGRNVLAVRMNDFSGGGGWYGGPVGLFSKDVLREQVYGITGSPADSATTEAVTELLDAQAGALAEGDVDAYLATLSPDYAHDGVDRDRRERQLTGWLADSDGSLTLTDRGVEVIAADDGRVLVDTNRSITGTRDGEPFTFQPGIGQSEAQEFLLVDPTGGPAGGPAEVGNRSRFFRDVVDSELEGTRREYVVYLPPSYHDAPDHHYPTVYLLHGINGGSREWEPRDLQTRLDELFTTGGLAESIVVMPDGESLWYIDSSAAPWRSMFIEELLPQVDAEYRTLPQREFRGMSGVSMGGHGTFTIGWDNPDLFASLASHMGALDLPPLVGTPAEIAANTPETPAVQVNGHTPELLSRFSYYMDACEDDDFAFDEALRAMSGQLTTKLVEHTAVVFPEGRHNDDCWLPHIDDSFALHSDSFRAAGLVEPPPPPPPSPTAERIVGPDRVATAIAVSARGFDSATDAVIASADAFPDALTASVLAGSVEGPLLLSPQSELPASVADELERLGVQHVHLAGGEAALSPAVAAALEDHDIAVTRLGGADRHATAALIAAEVDRLLGGVDGAVLARSDDFPDALGATNLALQVGWPILLSPTDTVPDVTTVALEDVLEDADPVVLAGGTAALSEEVAEHVDALGLTVDRRGGPDRYATAAALLAAAAEEGGDIDPAVVASGRVFPDALAAGVLAHRLQGAVLLVDPMDLDASPATRNLVAGPGGPTEVLIAGGTAAVSADVQQQIEALLAGSG